jgi:hypothetical protein
MGLKGTRMWVAVSSKVVFAMVALLAVASCAAMSGHEQNARETPEMVDNSQDAWPVLLQRMPYPYRMPLPTRSVTILDGEYVKVDPRPGERAGCRRCPPYPPEGGVWKFALDRGAFYVMHQRTEWKTLGSYSVSGDQLTISNDPHCPQDVGLYTWRLEASQLILKLVEDECGFGLRAMSFTAQPWLACQPTSEEAAVTDHWSRPQSCD